MKKFLFIPALIICLAFGQVANAFFNLNDVDESTYYFPAIDYFTENGVIYGYPDGEFKPDQCVNRVEFLKMLYLALNENISIDANVENIFSDVSKSEWYWPFLSHALIKDDVEGYEDGTFRPGECVNRVEAVKLAVLSFNEGKIPEYDVLIELPHDIENMKNLTNQWWWDYLKYALASQIVGLEHFPRFNKNDFSDYNFEPTEPMSRKEVAELLYRIKTVNDNNLDVYSDDDNLILQPLNFYRSPASGISFSFTDGWEVVDDYYYTLDDFTANFPTIVIKNIETGEEAIINKRFMQCIGVDAATCFDLEEGLKIGAEDPSEDAMMLMEKIMLTFRIPATFKQGVSTFVNETYGYSFKYPASLVINSNDYETPTNESFVIWVPSIDLNLEIQDPEVFEASGYGSAISLPLEEFAEYLRQENIRLENPNFPDKEIGELKETTVAGFDAYQFDLTYSFETERGGYVLDDKYEYLIFNNGTYHVVIWLPTTSDAAWAALATLVFE